MRKPLFYFICVFFISLALYPLFQSMSSEWSDRILVSAILILGIPHGAIDNILMKRRTGWTTIRFYLFYLSLIGLNTLLWFIYPSLSLFFFLLISSYHFGQAQLSHYFKRKDPFKNVLYLSWGNVVLSSFFLFNGNEIEVYFTDFPSLENIALLFHEQNLLIFLVLNLLALVFCFFYFLKKGSISIQNLAMESLILVMISLIAYVFHFIFGFAIFFILLHAIPVLMEEFDELYRTNNLENVLNFLKLLSPFSLISLFGIFGLLYLKEMEVIDLPYLFLILIATSSITLPHVWVMKKFYRD